MEDTQGKQGDKRRQEEAEPTLGKKIKTEPAEQVIGEYTMMEQSGEIEVLGNYTRTDNVSFRQKIRIWLDKYMIIDQQNLKSCLKDLVGLRSVSDKIWLREVLYLRDVQKRMNWIVKHLKTVTNQETRNELAGMLRQIFHPVDKVSINMVPNVRAITEFICIQKATKEPFAMRNIKQLPGIMNERMDQMSNLESNIRVIQMRLETTVKVQAKNRDNVYEYLVCVGVLKLFGFSLNGFLFQYHLSKNDMFNIVQMLDAHLKIFGSLHNKVQRQAYVLNLTFCCAQERERSLQYTISKFPEELCPELKDVRTFKQTSIATRHLRKTVHNLLYDSHLQTKLDLMSVSYSLIDQLHFLEDYESTPEQSPETTEGSLRKSVERWLNNLSMEKYYPQKLTYEDVIRLTPDFCSDANVTLGDVVQLPWYFMRHIIALDSDTRENCHVTKGNDADTSDSEDEDTDDVHPLDLIYIISLCADDFLRQELSDKMVKCQYAVPFILPSPEEVGVGHKSIILQWASKSIIRSFYSNNKVTNQTLVDIKAPVIVCMNIGKRTTWKEKVINKMLSPQQDTFWHKGLKGGDCHQSLSERMVDLAWYLPGRHGDDTFSHPVTFLNLRQNAEPCDVICEQLYTFSTLACIFVVEINDELRTFLKSKARDALNKVILIIL